MLEEVDRIMKFMDEALVNYESVLIHSLRGCDRSPFLTIVYLMKRYRWSVQKAIDFYKSRRSVLNLKNHFHYMLRVIETHFME